MHLICLVSDAGHGWSVTSSQIPTQYWASIAGVDVCSCCHARLRAISYVPTSWSNGVGFPAAPRSCSSSTGNSPRVTTPRDVPNHMCLSRVGCTVGAITLRPFNHSQVLPSRNWGCPRIPLSHLHNQVTPQIPFMLQGRPQRELAKGSCSSTSTRSSAIAETSLAGSSSSLISTKRASTRYWWLCRRVKSTRTSR